MPPNPTIAIEPPLLAELSQQHKPLIRQHLLALSPSDRRLRFGTPASDLAIRRYVDTIDFARDIVLGLVDGAGHLVGLGHLSLAGPIPELGISVDRSARTSGLGSLLLARACGHVREAGKDQLVMHYLPQNIALARLAARGGMRLVVVEGEGRALLTLPPLSPDHASGRISDDMADALELAFRLAGRTNERDDLTSA